MSDVLIDVPSPVVNVLVPGRGQTTCSSCSGIVGSRSLECKHCGAHLRDAVAYGPRSAIPKPLPPRKVFDGPHQGVRLHEACGRYISVRLDPSECPVCSETAFELIHVEPKAPKAASPKKTVAPAGPQFALSEDDQLPLDAVAWYAYGSFNGLNPPGVWKTIAEAEKAWAKYDQKNASMAVLIGTKSRETARKVDVRNPRKGVDRLIRMMSANEF